MTSYHRKRWKRFRRKRRRPRLIPAEKENDTSRQRRGRFAGLRTNVIKRHHHYDKDRHHFSAFAPHENGIDE